MRTIFYLLTGRLLFGRRWLICSLVSRVLYRVFLIALAGFLLLCGGLPTLFRLLPGSPPREPVQHKAPALPLFGP